MERDAGWGPSAETVGRDLPDRGTWPSPPGRLPGGFDLAAWFAAPRQIGPPGVFALGPGPRRLEPDEAAGRRTPGWKLLLRAALNLVVAWEVFNYVRAPMTWLTDLLVPSLARGAEKGQTTAILIAYFIYYGPVLLAVLWFFGRLGRWPLVWRRYGSPALARLVTQEPPGSSAGPQLPAQQAAPVDPWRELRAAAPPDVLALLDAHTAAGQACDVDHARLHRAWRAVSGDPGRYAAFLHELRAAGSAACAHPSGVRDLAVRTAVHDLLTAQVRLGAVSDLPRNPPAYRGVDAALDPGLLSGSLLAVGPPGSGKTAGLARPVAEGLCLQALAGRALVVVVGPADADLGPDEWYDVVVAPGSPRGGYGFDLFGAALGDEAAADRLADALLPEELRPRAEGARSALRAVLPAFRAGYGRSPGVRELCEVLRGEPEAWEALQEALGQAGREAEFRRHLDHRARRHGRADDPGALLADRLALLEHPEFADCFNPSATERVPDAPTAPALPLFAMRTLEHPLRVRIALPDRTNPEAAHIIGRLAAGQFLHAAVVREDRSLFAGLICDDAAAEVDPHLVRALQRLRGANAGALLVLRSLSDLPEALRTPLFGAVGGRMAFPGLAPWDGRLFSEFWGTEWVQEEDVTRTPDTSGGIARRVLRALRTVLAGERPETRSVTTRRVERQRWTPSDLAHGLPSGHAVLSLTAPDGTVVPPLLVRLRP